MHKSVVPNGFLGVLFLVVENDKFALVHYFNCYLIYKYLLNILFNNDINDSR